jgi:hypothetical protein
MARTARALVIEKQVRALSLVRSGSSYDEIASELGYANRGSAWRLVNNALKSAVDDVAQDYVRLELDRLEAVLFAYWKAAMSGDYAAANIVLKVLIHIDRLLGLDKPRPRKAAASRPPWGIVMTPEELAAWQEAGSPSTIYR